MHHANDHRRIQLPGIWLNQYIWRHEGDHPHSCHTFVDSSQWNAMNAVVVLFTFLQKLCVCMFLQVKLLHYVKEQRRRSFVRSAFPPKMDMLAIKVSSIGSDLDTLPHRGAVQQNYQMHCPHIKVLGTLYYSADDSSGTNICKVPGRSVKL